jgi:hypothetical protein
MLTIVYAQASQTGAASGTPKFLAIQHAAMGSVSENQFHFLFITT